MAVAVAPPQPVLIAVNATRMTRRLVSTARPGAHDTHGGALGRIPRPAPALPASLRTPASGGVSGRYMCGESPARSPLRGCLWLCCDIAHALPIPLESTLPLHTAHSLHSLLGVGDDSLATARARRATTTGVRCSLPCSLTSVLFHWHTAHGPPIHRGGCRREPRGSVDCCKHGASSSAGDLTSCEIGQIRHSQVAWVEHVQVIEVIQP